MSTRIEVGSESGIVALGDGQTDLPAGLDQEALLRRLEPLSRSAQVFYLVTDDPDWSTASNTHGIHTG